ncbi:H-NS histone family protein [Paraburkholderia sp. J63]|uniref:H-NS histone family protein n=1 Tax=Paraburkholderia sp. J63 TaxID=2805434 RepID=UPI002ABE3863|nr:H-NS histone family protein [Paraburkholderia sp. J63]
MVTLDAINLKIAKLQKQAATVAQKQSSAGLTKIRDLMNKYGLSVADIESFVGKKRGRKPSALAATGAAKTPQGVHHVEPKYADPKTGATWSGRGRAPAWISGAKDRSKFLIGAGANTKAADVKSAPAENAPAKRAAAKKSVAKKSVAKKAVAKKAVAKKAATRTARARGAASSADGVRARKAAAPAKKTRAPRKVATKKAPAAVEVAATPEVAAQ